MSEIKLALTKDEWRDPNSIVWGKASAVYPWITAEGSLSLECDDSFYHEELNAEQRLALAALCLHGQPFGFTREDLKGLRRLMQREGPRIHLYGSVTTLADRIEALLPPENPS